MLQILINVKINDDTLELELCLKSISKFLEKPYHITFISNDIKTVKRLSTNIKNKTFIQKETLPNKLDYTMFSLNYMTNKHTNFIWWHDDMYLTEPTTQHYIKKPKYFKSKYLYNDHKIISNNINPNTNNNYITHTPYFFKSNELKTTIKENNLTENPKMFIESIHYLNSKKTSHIELKFNQQLKSYIMPKTLNHYKFANSDDNYKNKKFFSFLLALLSK